MNVKHSCQHSTSRSLWPNYSMWVILNAACPFAASGRRAATEDERGRAACQIRTNTRRRNRTRIFTSWCAPCTPSDDRTVLCDVRTRRVCCYRVSDALTTRSESVLVHSRSQHSGLQNCTELYHTKGIIHLIGVTLVAKKGFLES